jgi:thioredoxin reductase
MPGTVRRPSGQRTSVPAGQGCAAALEAERYLTDHE